MVELEAGNSSVLVDTGVEIEQQLEVDSDVLGRGESNTFTWYGLGGKTVPFKEGGIVKGEYLIEDDTCISTWGGESKFSGEDGKNTHFIGHNPGLFKDVWKAREYYVTDSFGKVHKYINKRVYRTTSKGVGVKDGENYYSWITGTSGGERITVQTCVGDGSGDLWIVDAYKEG